MGQREEEPNRPSHAQPQQVWCPDGCTAPLLRPQGELELAGCGEPPVMTTDLRLERGSPYHHDDCWASWPVRRSKPCLGKKVGERPGLGWVFHTLSHMNTSPLVLILCPGHQSSPPNVLTGCIGSHLQSNPTQRHTGSGLGQQSIQSQLIYV